MEPEIIKVQADITDINAKLDEVERKFEQAEDAAKDYGKATEKASKEGTEGFKKQSKEIDNTTKKTSTLDKGMTKLGIAISGAFAVERVIQFGIEAVKAADRAKGIEQAFKSVGVSVLSLRKATQGTISDIDLMASAVNAKNLGVPVEELAGLLGFASARARETGQTVDVLVESIVNGLGRKSTLVLDNLGISSIDLKNALGDVSLESASVAQLTGALNKVIADQGGIAETTASGVQTLGAAWENYTIAVGKAINATDELGVVGQGLQDLSDITDRDGFFEGIATLLASTSGNVTGRSILSIQAEEARNLKQGLEDVAASQQAVLNGFDDLIDQLRSDLGQTEVGIVESLKAQLEQIEKQIDTAPSQERLNQLLRERLEIQNKITEVTTLAATGLIGSLKEQLTLVNSQIETAGNQERVNELLEKKVRLETELNAVLTQRQSLESFQADAEQPEELEFDQSFFEFENQKVDKAKETNDRLNEIADQLYESQIEANRLKNEQLQEDDEAYAAWKFEQDKAQAQATISIISNVFEAIRIIAGDNAEAQKSLAIFQATIDAYKAITSVYADPLLPTVAKLPLAVSIGALAFAQVAKIASTEPPKFYDGTEYVALNGNRPGKDTIPAMLNEGEGVVNSDRNRQFKGVVKSLNAGTFDKHYVKASHVEASLKALRKEQEREKTALLTAAIKGTVNANLNDTRIVGELRRSRRVNEEMAYLLAQQSNRRNPYRR